MAVGDDRIHADVEHESRSLVVDVCGEAGEAADDLRDECLGGAVDRERAELRPCADGLVQGFHHPVAGRVHAQAAAEVDADHVGSVPVDDRAQPCTEIVEAGFPRHGGQLPVDPHHRLLDAIGVVMNGRQCPALGASVATREGMIGVAAHPRDLVALDVDDDPAHRSAIYGPWAHFFPVALIDDAAWASTDERANALAETPQLPSGVLLAWFDHWLTRRAGVPVPSEPTFTSFEGPVGIGAGWRELDGWDPGATTGAGFRLGADGSLSVGPDATGSVRFQQGRRPDKPIDTLTFTSAPLASDQVLLGHASLTFRATLDAADAHFYVELCEVDPHGDETWVNDGYLAASHRRSHTEPEPVTIGASHEYRVGIRAHHYRFRAGSRVRIRVGGGPCDEADATADSGHRDHGDRTLGGPATPGLHATIADQSRAAAGGDAASPGWRRRRSG